MTLFTNKNIITMTDLFKFCGRLTFLFMIAFAMTLASCNKEDTGITSIENLADSTINSLQSRAIGKKACLEFVFPISIQFVDETTAAVDNYESLHTVISTWFEENGIEQAKENKPQLIFPIEVLNEEGEILTVASKEDLQTLRKECPGRGNCNGKRGKGFKCFSLVYPVTLTIGGVDTTFEDKESLKSAVKAYKESAGDQAVKPTLIFPVSVQYDDESIVIASSQEELRALKLACQDEEE